MLRTLAGLGLFFAVMLAVTYAPLEPAQQAYGQKKNDNDKDEQILRKKLADANNDLKQASNIINGLRKDVREREQAINQLQAALKTEKGEDEDKQLAQAKKDLAAAQSTISSLKKQDTTGDATTAKSIENLKTQLKESEGWRKAPFVHTVILKLKKDAPPNTAAAILADIPIIGKLPSVQGFWYGVRAPEGSPEFAVKDFEISLVLLFENVDGLKRYLDHPGHKRFVDKHLKFIETPLVYDSVKPMP